MADPKNQKIIAVIVARLATISTGSGYNFTFDASHVEDSRPNWDEAELPAISVIEGRTESREDPAGRRKTVHEMPVLIKIFMQRGTDASNARKAIADVKKAILGTGSETDGYLAERFPVVSGTKPGLATHTREVGHEIVYAKDSYEITGAEVEIAVQYMTMKFDAEN